MADESWRVPSTVQELAATVQEPPRRYLVPEQDRVSDQLAGAEMPEPVPTIDLRRLLAPDGADDEAAKLRSALQSWGFFLVTDHGIEAPLMDALIAASREFFRKPLEDKQACSNLVEGKQWQLEGYGNDPVKTQDQILDWCDRLHLRVEPEDERNHDRWPGHPESFRGLLHEYTVSCKRVKDGILRAMARLLDLDDDDSILNQCGDKGSTYARFNYYPACPRPDLVLGIRPHSDACVLTLLLMDEHVAGLQVLRDGTWYGVPPARDRALLVNVGVSLEIMSNGIFRGPVHRVVTNSEKERTSLAMLYAADPEKEIEPIGELVDEKQPARYRKIRCRDLVAAHYEYFSRRERVIESLRRDWLGAYGPARPVGFMVWMFGCLKDVVGLVERMQDVPSGLALHKRKRISFLVGLVRVLLVGCLQANFFDLLCLSSAHKPTNQSASPCSLAHKETKQA